jgi:hypothetical protein
VALDPVQLCHINSVHQRLFDLEKFGKYSLEKCDHITQAIVTQVIRIISIFSHTDIINAVSYDRKICVYVAKHTNHFTCMYPIVLNKRRICETMCTFRDLKSAYLCLSILNSRVQICMAIRQKLTHLKKFLTFQSITCVY